MNKLIFLFIILSNLLFSQSTIVRQLKGFWNIEIDKWQPSIDFGGDSIFVLAPSKIELVDKKYGSNPKSPRWVIKMTKKSDSEIFDQSFYESLGSDSVFIVIRGYSGIKMSLKIDKDTLKGFAETFWDFPREVQKTKVMLIRCKHH